MRDVYKNPTLYYVLVPVAMALWPLFVGGLSLPQAKQTLAEEMKEYGQAEKVIEEILTLDRDRLDFDGAKEGAAEFVYATEVDKVARLCDISSANYELNSKPKRTAKGQVSQGCRVVLKQVDIATFARFLSTLQIRWTNLQCENITLTKRKDLPDAWKVDLNFKYYY
jgi:hypothetical protein